MKKIRYRYVVFEISGERVDKRAVIKWLNSFYRDEGLEDFERLRLVYFRDNVGLVRCPHTRKERVIELINGVKFIAGTNAEVKTVGTSGTIKSALSKYVKGKRK